MRSGIRLMGLASAVFALASCQLITVPVKTAGGIVETTISTSGKVVEAPFNAAGGRGREKPEKQTGKEEGRR